MIMLVVNPWEFEKKRVGNDIYIYIYIERERERGRGGEDEEEMVIRF